MEWDDDEDFGGGGPTLEWDETGIQLTGAGKPKTLPPSPPPPPPQPKETDFFRSFLNTAREEQREKLSTVAKSVREANVSRRAVSPGAASTQREEDDRQEKQKEATTRTYLDFLLHKRHQTARERAYELRQQGYKIPEGREYFSFIGEPVTRTPEFRRHTLPAPGKEPALREPSWLHELSHATPKSFEGMDESYKGQLSAILAEGDIDWDASFEGVPKADTQQWEQLQGMNLEYYAFNMQESPFLALNTLGSYGKDTSLDKSKDDEKDISKSVAELIEKALDYLIDDVYFPGVIDDAVNGKINFNQIAFNLVFDDDDVPEDAPPMDKQPISLIEAFDKRVERQKGAIKKTTMQSPPPSGPADLEAEMEATLGDIQEPEGGERPDLSTFVQESPSKTKVLNREELVLASTVGIDVSTIVQNKPVNELIMAINSLQKAEYMNDYDKSFQAAEEAYKRAPPELAESVGYTLFLSFIK
ncbi:unnamed protein product [Hermetia illucens]|uniref:Uncharacterized protein n=1 Tax=Hermetia illucens TaxID=343691 RepID=A0A7R8YT93_HERIL|nr:unnamed protein product [Hermetia illucens]